MAREGLKLRKRACKVGVLMKGPSSEKKISLKSGRAVLKALRSFGVNAIPVIIERGDIKENIRLIRAKAIDVAFIALHGKFGEDGTVQKILGLMGIPYTGSGVKASRLAMDKAASRRIFKRSGLNVPKSKVIKSISGLAGITGNLKFPLVIKPATHGSSIGFSIIRSSAQLKKAVRYAMKFDRRVILEEFIKGREVTVGILEEKALPIIEIIPKHSFFDYKSKYKKGLTKYIVPARIPAKIEKEVKKHALMAHNLLGCKDFSRVDIIINEENKPYILEINTIPGFTELSLLPKAALHAGINFKNLCARLIELAYEKKQD